MTHAESLAARINRHMQQVRVLVAGLGEEEARVRIGHEWSAREVLLHLIGDTADVPAGVQLAVTQAGPVICREQRGGEYLAARGSDSPDGLLETLLRQMDAIRDAVSGLSDESLGRPLTIGDRNDVPVGLWVRDVVGEHFELHLKQLELAIARAKA
jgi:hypothetical protein